MTPTKGAMPMARTMKTSSTATTRKSSTATTRKRPFAGAAPPFKKKSGKKK
jgi:hypothetical protein